MVKCSCVIFGALAVAVVLTTFSLTFVAHKVSPSTKDYIVILVSLASIAVGMKFICKAHECIICKPKHQ